MRSVTARATPLFIRRDGRTCRVLDVSVALTGLVPGLSIQVEAGGRKVETPVLRPPLFGSLTQEVAVPESAEPVNVTVRATGGGHSKSTSVRLLPQRKWLVFVAPSAHTDIGYTDLQPKCAERHCRNIDAALDLVAKYPDFFWNLEVAYQADEYLRCANRSRSSGSCAAREGKIGVQALFCNVLTGLCSAEEACRLTAFAYNLSRDHQVPYRSAMISDVPTQEASLPMILANAGIRYFSSGINNDRAYPFTAHARQMPLLVGRP